MSVNQLYPINRVKAACTKCSVLSLCLPVGMTIEEAERLDKLIGQRFKVKKGGALYRVGDPMRSLYAVRVGSFKTNILSIEGREQVTGFQMPGEILGFDGISTDLHTCSAFALEDSEICPIPFAQLERLARELPSLQHNLSKALSQEIIRDHDMVMMLANMSSSERFAAFLLDLSQRLSQRGYSSRELVLRMCREEIASYLGLRMETVCRCIAELREKDLVIVNGRNVKFQNIEGLRQLVADYNRHRS